MAKYRKIDPRIWNDQKFRSLSDAGKLAFFYVLTHPHMTAVGALRATFAGLAHERRCPAEDFREALAKGMLEADEEAALIVAPNFLAYNAPESPNVVRAWRPAYDLLPECELRDRLFQKLKDYVHALPDGFGKAFMEAFADVFAKSMPIQEQEQEQEQRTGAEETSSGQASFLPGTGNGSNGAHQAKPKDPSPGSLVWSAYEERFEKKYGVKPLRNAKNNALCQQAVERLGATEAPKVAAFYLRSKTLFYSQRRHDFGLFVRDCEQLRVEMSGTPNDTGHAGTLRRDEVT